MLRTLLIVLLCLSGSASAQGEFAAWEQKMLFGDFDAAATQARGIAQLHETSSVWAYRTAASLARAGNLDRSIVWLETAAERGYSGVRTIETDSDIDAIRGLPAFAGVVERVKANVAERMAGFKQAVSESTPTVIRPRGHDPAAPTPVLLVLHGTGGTGKATARQWRSAAARAGVVLITPDALRPSGNGFAWVFRDESEWYVEHLIAEARKDFAVGPVIVAGFSQGANIAMAMGRSHPSLFDGVIAVCGHWEDDVAAMPEGDDRPGWYLLIGERDPWVETNSAAERALDGAGTSVELRVVPRLRHEVPPTRELFKAVSWCLESAEPGSD